MAGAAALVWSVNSDLTPDQVEDILRQGAVDLGKPGRDDVFGAGMVDASRTARLASLTLASAPTTMPRRAYLPAVFVGSLTR